MSIDCISYDEYSRFGRNFGGGHWKGYESRWAYHEAAIDCVRQIPLSDPAEVLELGTMGVAIVKGSHTMDYQEKWRDGEHNPTYRHDARVIPWPVADKQYELFIALRVFHHLTPKQGDCFREAKRIARNLIIVAPESYDVDFLADSKGIPERAFVEWNDGIVPRRIEDFGDWRGKLYFWTEDELR